MSAPARRQSIAASEDRRFSRHGICRITVTVILAERDSARSYRSYVPAKGRQNAGDVISNSKDADSRRISDTSSSVS